MSNTITTLLKKERKDAVSTISLDTGGMGVDDLLGREYLLTNTRGGYSAGTVVGCNTRRYHGLLIGSLNPPANRILGLSNLLETIVMDTRLHHITTFEFNEKISPAGFQYVKRFRRDVGAHFDYEFDGIELTKSVYLSREDDIVIVEYDFRGVERPFDFILRPFAALRDFHTLQKSYAPLCSAQLGDSIFICHDVPNSCELLINCGQMTYEKDPQWWFNFVYRRDRERGQEFQEDLWAPGFYKRRVRKPGKIIFKASMGRRCSARELEGTSVKQIVGDLNKVRRKIAAGVRSKDEKIRELAVAGDAFICRRRTNGDSRSTILAGFPWFFDWGRDAFISLPGLLLATGRNKEARSVLTTFAAVADEGMIPNRFDDRSHTAYFNSIDTSLWFINACFQYLKASGDGTTFTGVLLPVILDVVEAYRKGTRFGIVADSDMLITGGNKETQLTWMDAKFEGTAFTPRHGKAVEVNALWFNALSCLAKFYATWKIEEANRFDELADIVGSNFRRVFWNEKKGYLNDCIYPDGSVDESCRCNQIFAVSLEFSPLSAEQQFQVVEVVRSELLTPYGLRSLSPSDANYKGAYTGPQRQRDESYHQGTVWAYLIGPFVEGYLKVNDFSERSRQQARQFVEPLLEHLRGQACLGSVSEIFDGEPPHTPRGCFAQAWSVAELTRALALSNG